MKPDSLSFSEIKPDSSFFSAQQTQGNKPPLALNTLNGRALRELDSCNCEQTYPQADRIASKKHNPVARPCTSAHHGADLSFRGSAKVSFS